MLSILLLSTLVSSVVLLSQIPSTEASFLDYVEAQYQKAVQNRLSKFHDNDKLSAAYSPLVEAGQQSVSSRSIGVETLTVGDRILLKYTAPDPATGRVILRLMENETNDLILNIGIRYTFGSEKNVLVLNHRKNNVFGSKIRPSGFDFSPNIDMQVLVSVEDEGFHISTIANGNDQFIGVFPYRLPVDLVNIIRLQTERNSVIDTGVTLGAYYSSQKI